MEIYEIRIMMPTDKVSLEHATLICYVLSVAACLLWSQNSVVEQRRGPRR